MPRGARLLGAPRVWHAGEWRDLPLDKRLGLLTYLACAESWVSRERLSYLFWPDVPTAQARINLRQLLARARTLPLGDALEGDETRLRWRVESDVGAFRRALAAEDWRDAAYAYAGDLAEGLEVDDASEFSSWLELERSQLRESYRRAALRHAEAAVAAGRPEEAEATYERLLAQDPLDEAVVRSSMRLHVRFGDPDEARRLYRRFAARLAEEVGLEPAAATAAVLREGPPEEPSAERWPATEGPPRRAGPREPLTSFVGREAELRVVEERLTGDECRLLTVLGPGGVGKTRLALRSAERLAERFEGVVLVPLAEVSSPDEVPLAVARAAGVRLRGGQAPLDQVVAALERRHLLLLLDDFDHLVSGALVVAELLAGCPRLRCLVTSRERLRLQGEWLLPLDGLPVPAADVADADEALTYGAVRLLADRARQVAPTFELRGADLDSSVALCRLLGGLPLAVELAAGSLRTLSLGEVLAALEDDVLSLESDARDLPSRHRSLRAAFEHSWRLLTASEREAYRRLAAFAGEFGELAAEAVAGASRPLLGALVEKSLLRQSGPGRYVMHPLLRELARGLLREDPDEAEALRDAHAHHHLRLLASWVERLHGPQQALMLEELTPDYPDLIAAWLRGVARGWDAACRTAGEPLVFFHGIQGRFHEGESLFARALGLLAGGGAERRALLGYVLVHLGWFRSALGRFDEAVAAAQQALAVAEGGDPRTELLCWQVLGTVAARRGDDEDALRWLSRGLAIAEDTGDAWSISLLSGNLGLAELKAGRHDEAERHFEQSLEHNRALGNAAGIVNDLDYLGRLSLARGDLEGAARRFEQGLELADRARFRQRVPYLELQLSAVARARGETADAERHAARALGVATELGQRALQVEARLVLGQAAAAVAEGGGADAGTAGGDDGAGGGAEASGGGAGARGAYAAGAAAKELLEEALAQAWELAELPLVLAAVLELARLGAPAGGSVLLALVAAHPASRPEHRALARQLLAARAPWTGPLPSLGDAVARLLGRGGVPGPEHAAASDGPEPGG
ncbi:MAG TPA: tetratricopeptide repeat protein [Trueperaceae bacterium]